MDRFAEASRNGAVPVDPRGITTHDFGFTVSLTVEKDIPLPAQQRGRDNNRPTNPIEVALLSMDVGDSMHIPAEIAVKTKSVIQALRKQRSRKRTTVVFSQRQISPGKKAFRVWRIS